ncbi:glycosyl transferase [Thalassobaculum fulvum]|uniref:Glycosyl transferase n=1 Tax=Thalassobaculum fulvum TaxID=1633335 RepID=A0A919CQT5_9PROT|nr:glycosyltransferase family 4 protein [Thalassobaculum fulvum]GHD50006.1 glycosyl transferase [Thalassobaculum fulvum]
MPTPSRILVVAHNHPSFHPGGTEFVAHGLFRHWRDTAGRDVHFVAAASPEQRHSNPGTVLQSLPGARSEYLVRVGQYDWFHHLQRDKIAVFTEFGELLRTLRPDVVHFHHFLGFGTEVLPFVRRCLPDAVVVLTVHDYYFACHHDGIMVKYGSNRLCYRSGIDACHACFPQIPGGSFKLREINLKHHFAAVDHLVAPSALMRDRLVDWGMEPDRVSVIRNGRDLGDPVPARPLREGDRRNRFAILGNVSPAKGQKVALRAVQLLLADGVRDIELAIHGAPHFQTDDFKGEIDSLLADCKGHARLLGGYEERELPERLAEADWIVVPSLWWENAPLVLDEAFHHGRPPICGAIGGMAERVRDGVDGLHFAVGDPRALADRLRAAIENPALWETLRDRAPATRDAAACAAEYQALFDALAARRPVKTAVPASSASPRGARATASNARPSRGGSRTRRASTAPAP